MIARDSIRRSAMSGLALTAAVLMAATAFADGRRDYYFQESIARYFNQPQNARSFGMEGSVVSTSSDVSNVVGNPAGLGWLQGGDFSVSAGHNTISGNEHPSYKKIQDNINDGSSLMTLPLGPVKDDLPDYGNIGFGWSGYRGHTEDSTFGVEDAGYQLYLAYGAALDEAISWGAGLTYVNDNFKGDNFHYQMENGFRYNLGMQDKLDKDTTLGVSTFIGYGSKKNQIGAIDLFEKSYLLETGLDVGVGYHIDDTLLAFSVDYEHYGAAGNMSSGPVPYPFGGDEVGNVFNVRLGIEQPLTDWLVVRGGYRYAALADYSFQREELEPLNGSAKFNAWSAGIGVNWPVDSEYVKAVKLDYGVEYRSVGDQDWEHLVTLSVPFGVCS